MNAAHFAEDAVVYWLEGIIEIVNLTCSDMNYFSGWQKKFMYANDIYCKLWLC